MFLLCKGVANITFLMNGLDFDSHWNSGGPSVPTHLCFLVWNCLGNSCEEMQSEFIINESQE